MVKISADQAGPETQFAEWRGWYWRAKGYVIVPPDDRVARAYLGDPPPSFDWTWTEGVFLSRSRVAGPSDPSRARSAGPDWPPMYNVAEKAHDILRAALTVDANHPESLLAFVNQWGVLSVGKGLTGPPLRPSQRPTADTVWATRRAVTALQWAFRWLRALQAKRWGSPDIPSLYSFPASRIGGEWEEQVRAAQADRGPYMEAARALLPPPERERLVHHMLYSAGAFGDANPYLESFAKGHQQTWRVRQLPPADRPRGYWLAFSAAITAHLRGVHPTIGWHDRPTPTWVVARPIDAAWIALWDWVTRGARLRRCQHCREWFAPERRGKVYCSTTCANRATSARAYEGKKRQRRARPGKGGRHP